MIHPILTATLIFMASTGFASASIFAMRGRWGWMLVALVAAAAPIALLALARGA